jgi:hypothetical protein
MTIAVKSEFGLHSTKRKALVFVSLLLVLLVSLLVGFLLVSSESFSLETVVHVGSEQELRSAVNNARLVPAVIVLDNDITLTENLVISTPKRITLTSNSENDGFFRLFGASGADTIVVGSRGVLHLEGVVVTHKRGMTGRGVVVQHGGILILSEGEISDNTANTDGGGICNSGRFTMLGGKISGNTAKGNDYAGRGWGGGIYNNGTFTLYEGEIYNNTARIYGGGIYDSTNFSMFSGTISNNIASYGGGVSNGDVYDNSNFSMFGGIISNNTASAYGGGVYSNERGNFTMFGGTISNNIGSGVFNAGNFTMIIGTISGNTASAGGGVSNVASFNLLGGLISNNTASDGGGLYFQSGSFSMLGGEISNNKANRGGGIIVYSNFNMTDGVISSNQAVNGGGIYIDGWSWHNTTISGGRLSNNIASNRGGGIWVDVANLDRLTISDGVIFGDNLASVTHYRDSVYDEIYYTNIGKNIVWTEPLTQGYNNHDIGIYVYRRE